MFLGRAGLGGLGGFWATPAKDFALRAAALPPGASRGVVSRCWFPTSDLGLPRAYCGGDRRGRPAGPVPVEHARNQWGSRPDTLGQGVWFENAELSPRTLIKRA